MNPLDRKAISNLVAAAHGEAAPYPDLDVTALSDEMRMVVRAYVELLLRERDVRRVRMTDEEVYLTALDHFGLACPHPVPPAETYATTTWSGFRCRVCGSTVFTQQRDVVKRGVLVVPRNAPEVEHDIVPSGDAHDIWACGEVPSEGPSLRRCVTRRSRGGMSTRDA
jgi:hypothetical protein